MAQRSSSSQLLGFENLSRTPLTPWAPRCWPTRRRCSHGFPSHGIYVARPPCCTRTTPSCLTRPPRTLGFPLPCTPERTTRRSQPSCRAPPSKTGRKAASEVTSRIFAVRHGDEVLAAGGYRPWLQTVAHMSVLTDAHRRGGGLAQQVALVASRDAVGHRLVAQWRARPPQSRRVAEKLGYEAAGSQLSL